MRKRGRRGAPNIGSNASGAGELREDGKVDVVAADTPPLPTVLLLLLLDISLLPTLSSDSSRE